MSKNLPHIKLHLGVVRQYKCSADNKINGFGMTPILAFCDWLIKNNRKVRVPRRGIWNKQSCRQRFPWYAPYKKGTNMFMMHQGIVRQIYDYDYKTDELILRG